MNMDMIIVAVIPGLYGLLHLAGFILALVYWRRCPKACSLLFMAALLNLLATLTLFYFLAVPDNRQAFFVPGIVFASILQWIAYGLLLMAIFAGRNDLPPKDSRPSRPIPDDDDDWPPSIAKPSTDIQGR